MAKLKSQTVILKKDTPQISRPGVHSKTKTSKLKSSKNYRKLYKGQGK
jgi:hypothetical protein